MATWDTSLGSIIPPTDDEVEPPLPRSMPRYTGETGEELGVPPVPTEPTLLPPPPPAAQLPISEPPVAPPVAQPPVTQPPVSTPPVAQPPVAQPPVAQPPVAQPPSPSADGEIDEAVVEKVMRLIHEDKDLLSRLQEGHIPVRADTSKASIAITSSAITDDIEYLDEDIKVAMRTRKRKNRNQDSLPSGTFRRTLYRMGIKVPKSREDKLRDEAKRCYSLRLDSSKTIGVSGPKGGAGKTVISVIIAQVFAQWRKGSTVVIIGADRFGTLNVRSPEGSNALSHNTTVHKLYTELQKSNLNVDPFRKMRKWEGRNVFSVDSVHDRTHDQPASAEEITWLIDYFHSLEVDLVVIDLPTSSYIDPNILSRLDALIMAAPPTKDESDGIDQTPGWLEKMGQDRLLPNIIVAVNNTRQEPGKIDLDEFASHLKNLKMPTLIELPWDREISLGDPLYLERLSELTRRQYMLAGAFMMKILAHDKKGISHGESTTAGTYAGTSETTYS